MDGFSNDFLWGAASAAHQIEGAYNEDGKGLGIWDAMTQEPGHIAHGETGNIACDHYHRYKEDVSIMKSIGLKSYRFSISWPRVLPEGTGKINEAGLTFYENLVSELLDAGIEPMITLYHWNLPMALYEKGGWKNPDSPLWFEEYVGVITKTFKGKVKYWITLNEPQVFVGGGLAGGVHAPFEQNSSKSIMDITKHLLLAHGRAVQMIHKNCGSDVKIGFAPTGECVIPKDLSSESIEEARKLSFSINPMMFPGSNTWWADPIFKGSFPEEAKRIFGNQLPDITSEEWQLISQPLDFYGFNIYQAGGNPFPPNEFGYDRYSYQGSPRTAMDWNITPDVMYWCCKFFYERYEKPILITENGMSCFDFVSLDGKVHDPARIDFMHRYLLSLRKAVEEDIPVIGYQYWSIMDNYEWAAGYDKRFGLVYVDYRTQERTLKDSAYWYKELILSNGKNL